MITTSKPASVQKKRGSTGVLKAPFLALASMPPFVMLLLILALAAAVTALYMNWSDSPQVLASVTYFTHHHPRLSLILELGFVLAPALLPVVVAWCDVYAVRRKGILPQRKSPEYLNQAIKLEVPVGSTRAWQALKTNFSEEVIQTSDTRRSHWEITELNENRRQLKLSLRYTHNPLGRKKSQFAARSLTCSTKVTGRGTQTEIELTFGAKSPMDYETVRELIERTQERLCQVLTKPEVADSKEEEVPQSSAFEKSLEFYTTKL